MFTILLINSAAFYAYYVVELSSIRSAMRSKLKFLPDEDLERLVLSIDEYADSKVDEHEMRVAGKMYDIARVEVHRDSVVVFCLHDRDEDNLIALVGALVGRPLESRSEMPPAIIQFISMNFIFSEQEISIGTDGGAEIKTRAYCFSIRVAFPEIPTPPPRITRDRIHHA